MNSSHSIPADIVPHGKDRVNPAGIFDTRLGTWHVVNKEKCHPEHPDMGCITTLAEAMAESYARPRATSIARKW